VKLDWEIETMPNPDPDPEKRKKIPIVSTDDPRNKLFNQLLSLKICMVAVKDWKRMTDDKDKAIPFDPELFEYMDDPIVIDLIANEILDRAAKLIQVEKKS